MIAETASPQPPIQPIHGPKAFVAQVNVVPQSGVSWDSSRYAKATRSIGMNASTNIDGDFSPTAATT
jgi:hypothetical protein